MRDFVLRLRASAGLLEPSLVAGSVLVLTSLIFFRSALITEFGDELGMSTFELGALITVFGIARLLADLPGGYLADRIAATKLMAGAAVGVTIGALILGLAGSTLPVYIAVFLMGLGSATTNATGMTYYSTVGGRGSRGTAMAIFSASLLGGQAIGPAVGGLIASVSDWRIAMYVAAAVASVVAVGLIFGTRNRHRPVTNTQEPSVPATKGGVPWHVIVLLRSVPFVVFMTLGSVPQTLVPIVGSNQLGLTAAGIGLGLGAGGAARFVGTIIGGRLSDLVSRKAALVPGLLGQAVGVGILAFPVTLASWVTAIVLMSLASYAVSVAATMVGDLADPSRVGGQLGRFRFSGDVGLVVGPITISAIFERVGPSAAFLLVAGLLTVVGLACLKLPETGHSSSVASFDDPVG